MRHASALWVAGVAGLSLLLQITILTAGDAAAAGERGVPGAASGNYAAQYEQAILQGVKLSDVFQLNGAMTTPFGPAYANIWTEDSNFLACNPPQGLTFSYALCYYSGPNEATGINSGNPPLPCSLSPDGKVANCTCYKLSSDQVPLQVPYFVDIHAILNQEIYEETVAACGREGERCAPSTSIEAPVCDAINSGQLMPGADLVSVFSPVLKLDYAVGATLCSGPGSVYAGCMTAPCTDSGETDAYGVPLVDCSCPIFEGRYEIGQEAPPNMPPLDCDLGPGNIWSAAHNPITNNAIDPVPPPNTCIPDAPPDAGCPLFPDGIFSSFDPGSAVCQAVCEAYRAPDQDGVQLGYACDSTLCTTLGLGQDQPLTATTAERFGLMGDACSGVQNLDGLELIAEVETLAGCSCCASQLCGCAESDINNLTDGKIFGLNQGQRAVGITPQCDINGTLCGSP